MHDKIRRGAEMSTTEVTHLPFARPARQGRWSEAALRVLRERYLLRNEVGEVIETPEDMCWRVAMAIAQAEARYARAAGRDEKAVVQAWAERFYDLMIEQKFLPNSPTMMNAGKGNNLQYSACYVLPVGDSMVEIFEAIKNAALIHQSGGGTGFAFSRLRPAGSLVHSSGGRASGPVSFLRVFNAATEAVKQGGTRRGANMGILRVDHPDIEEFITCKLDGSITNFNISVAATDAFMKAVMEDTEYDILAQPGWPDGKGGRYQGGEVIGRKRARDIFQKIVEAAWRTGDPGLVFIDRINRSPANPVPDLETIEATNPCVPADTWVMTEQGPRQVRELLGRPTRLVLNGRIYPTAQAGFFFTGVRPLLRVETQEGYSLRLTADHLVRRIRWITRCQRVEEWVPAGKLQPGDLVTLHDPREFVSWPGPYGEQEGYLVGLLIGNETVKQDEVALPVWAEAAGAEGMMTAVVMATPTFSHQANFRGKMHAWGEEWRFSFSAIKPVVIALGLRPGSKTITAALEKTSASFYCGFLRGIFDRAGSIQDSQHEGITVRLSRSDPEFLRAIQRMLLRLGITSRIHPPWPTSVRPLSNGRDDHRTEADKAQYELVIASEALTRFAQLVGFAQAAKREQLLEALKHYCRRPNRPQFVATVVQIVPDGEEPVYDVQVPHVNAFDANGFVVHNCGEQPLAPNDACNLGSINLAKFVLPGEWVKDLAGAAGRIDWTDLERTVRRAVRFLDDVIEVNPYPLPEINAEVKANRRIGLGVMGWADMLFALGIPYDSEEALELAHRVMGFIREIGHDSSAQLAEERGPFPNWPHSIYAHDRPLRNATVTTIAPTGTISIIAGASSGIEPIFALAFSHIVGNRHLVFINPVFEQVAREHGFFSEELMRRVAETGTLHGIEGIPDDVRRVFVTAHEIAPEWHVRMQGAFQKHTDNGVSKCVAGDTLIFTEHGIISIASLYQGEPPDSFRPLELTVADNPAPVEADLFYYGGEQPVVGVETDLGITLRATPNHQVRVIRDGEIIWCRMDELKKGDHMVVPYGYGVFGHRYEFSQVYGAPYRPAERANTSAIQWPYRITTDLARALGYLVAEGEFNQESVIFTQADPEVLADYCQIMQSHLGLTPYITPDKRREGTKLAILRSRDLVAFFSEYLGCGQSADHKRTPPCILQAGPEIQQEFIRGLTLEGYVRREDGRLVVVRIGSRQLAIEVQAMLLNLGIPARLEAQPMDYDYTHGENRQERIYDVIILPTFRLSFLEQIGYVEARKQEAAWEILRGAEDKIKPDASYVIPGVRSLAVRLAQRKQTGAVSQKIKDYLRSFINAEAEITRDKLLSLLDVCRDLESTSEWQKLNAVATRQALYTPITRIWWDRDLVYDLQIPKTHSFITNGFISHNTINLPNSATMEDVAKAFLLAYEVGCLGITVFRDGCKGVQVLHVGTKPTGKGAVEDERQAKEALAQVGAPTQSAEPLVGKPTSDGYYQKKPRPAVLHGSTYRRVTPLGTAYITINTDSSHQPFEVFLNVGKAGSDVAAVSEALGRLISLILRLPSSLSPRERLEEVVEQLVGIGGGRPMGIGPYRVRSLPDAVAQVLSEYLREVPPEGTPDIAQLALPFEHTSKSADLCPECGQATFVFEEGCKKCVSCGLSEC
jgi:ribonucleoside-diphosphate reductase alpha chain